MLIVMDYHRKEIKPKTVILPGAELSRFILVGGGIFRVTGSPGGGSFTIGTGYREKRSYSKRSK
jgi:hypothetical protein